MTRHDAIPKSTPEGSWEGVREALLRATLALSVDERITWLEEMMAIAVESGALPKRVPDQLVGLTP